MIPLECAESKFVLWKVDVLGASETKLVSILNVPIPAKSNMIWERIQCGILSVYMYTVDM